MLGVTAIRIVKGDKVFHVHGDRAGQEGVWLAHGQVQGIYDAPVQTTWKTGAFQAGSTQKSRKWLHRDMTLGFHIKETYSSWEFNDSMFRQIFDYEEDPWDANYEPTSIEVQTTISGVRKLDVLMYEAPDFDSEIDPQQQQYGNVIMKLRAGDPFWYSDDVVSTFTETTTNATGFVTVANPTDQVMYQKWVLTRGVWDIPDYEWKGARGFRTKANTRTISGIQVGSANGGAVVDLDRQELMFRDQNNTNILAQLGGKFFEYPVPPYTPAQNIPVSYTNAPAGGATVQLRQPRKWSRPWGMELSSDPNIYSGNQAVTFTGGTYAFTIPGGTTHIDVVLLGGGGGGGGGTLAQGDGGGPGGWYATTLVRGTDIPAEATRITGSIGQGGSGGARGNVNNGGYGRPTSAVCGSWMRTGPAGAGSGSNNNDRTRGIGPGNLTYNGRTYVGGTNTTEPGQPGNAPGGGGAGGRVFSEGGTGAQGQAWFYAYKVG